MKKNLFLSVTVALFLLFANIGCKKEGLDAAAAGKANLTFETVKGPNDLGCGGYLWDIIFHLNDAGPKGGWIVQKITIDREVIPCPDGPSEKINNTYWEAWRITAGSKEDSDRLANKNYTFDDEFSAPDKPNTKGHTNVTGEVKFFEDATLSDDFKKENPDTYAHGLPSTTKEPKFWDNSNAAGHNLNYLWNCCTNPGTHKLTTTAATYKAPVNIPADQSKLDNTGKLIVNIPGWINNSGGTFQQLITIARQIQNTTTPSSLRNSLVNYENVFAGTSDYLDQMSKVYLLLRVLYQLPQELNRTNAKNFSGWMHPSIASGPAYNMTWPVFVTPSGSGFQISVAQYPGFIGRGYNAAGELDYFNSNFPKRNL